MADWSGSASPSGGADAVGRPPVRGSKSPARTAGWPTTVNQFDHTGLTDETAWQRRQRTRPPACSRPTGMPRANGAGDVPGLHRDVTDERDGRRGLLPAGPSARTSRANAVQLSNRPPGSFARPRNTAADSRARDPRDQSPSAGGTTFVWLTMVADGVGPSMQLRPR